MQPSDRVREEVRGFTPYAPGLSMEEIKEKYGGVGRETAHFFQIGRAHV